MQRAISGSSHSPIMPPAQGVSYMDAEVLWQGMLGAQPPDFHGTTPTLWLSHTGARFAFILTYRASQVHDRKA